MNSITLGKKGDVSIVLCGAAGQGIKTVEKLLTKILHKSGYHVCSTKEYMSRIRGGTNSTEIRIASKPVRSFVNRIDLFIPLNKNALKRLNDRISKDTLILGEKENIDKKLIDKNQPVFEIAFNDIAKEIGNPVYSNIIAIGVIAKILDVEKKLVKKYVTEAFEDKGKKILNKNYEALNKGYEISKNLITEKSITCSLTKDQEIAEYILYNGAETVGMGAIAGGCNFICSYPMSPSTGVLVFLANHSHEFDILVEQAEDEIAAINSGLGAFYAGGRSMITTSGGGLALMGEGISLSGMTETPIVMHVAQRPGPATGLPTQTEQGDLELVMHSGHGFFPRIILAPGTLEEAFYLTQKAFNLADKYQVPVIVLTDQFLMDLHYNFPKLSLENLEIINHVVTTAKDYQRYKYTKNGISPRGIPGNGKGLVRADSDEHDQDGFITEDLDTTRIKMVEKRRKKFQTIQEDTIPPTLIGEEEYSILLVGWGSVFPAVTEALGELQKEEVSFLHFSQVFPLPEEAEKYLKQADKIVLIENNSSGQFGKHLQKYIGIKPNHEILKYNGMPFSVEELIENISTIMEEH